MIRVGIFFGGASREREVSFAGGRTVYDNLDKELFAAVPIFVDAKGNFVELNWEYIYRGTIRDFFPPAPYLPQSENNFQIYSESLELPADQYKEMLESIGKPINLESLKDRIDFAFLALHGLQGEDGSIQGVLEWLGIPYSGSGILPSALGVSKKIQKQWWPAGLSIQNWQSIDRSNWEVCDKIKLFEELKLELGLPFVAKASNQGSSIGVQIIQSAEEFEMKVDQAFFKRKLSKSDWQNADKLKYIREITDLRTGLGLPLMLQSKECRHPEILLSSLNQYFEKEEQLELQALSSEYELVFEEFLNGREFSCIVIQDEQRNPLALPPTEVVKGAEIFDYSSKYLPGLSHKQTPISIEAEMIDEIRKACVELFNYFEFEVYARIDGFITSDGIFLNDPNTTSGMMPSSFFFHQAAEIGLGPKHFISYIIRTSLQERFRKNPGRIFYRELMDKIDKALIKSKEVESEKLNVAVVMGGYSTERHISVESGRNIYEKLSSSVKYSPKCIFLTGGSGDHHLFELPVNIMLKDNADDIRSKVEHYKSSSVLEDIRRQASDITAKYLGENYQFNPVEISYQELSEKYDEVFIALHGRPGEDGEVQSYLDQFGISYNGSGVDSSRLSIDKYLTNRMLRENGILVADDLLVEKEVWNQSKNDLIRQLEEFGYPIICKPHDEGCSSAVIKIENREMLETYAQLCFGLISRSEEAERILHIGPKDEFPSKSAFLAEKFTSRQDAKRFLEITGGMLTHQLEGEIRYEVFEPSEALSSGNVLSLAEKFLAGEGQNITPARFSNDQNEQRKISEKVRIEFEKVARIIQVEGYCRIDAFVRIYDERDPDVIIIEVNSLPGMTPATCIYHQAAINGYKPYDFIDKILEYGKSRSMVKIG